MKPALFSLIPALAVLTSCGSDRPAPAEAEAASKAPVAVSAATVEQQTWPGVYEATGTVRARTAATISAKVMGYVQQVSVQAGDRVTAGQLLITLDSRDLEPAVRRAEAARAEVRSAIPEADNGVAAARAGLDLAQATFSRIQDLANKKSVSAQELDEATARLKAATAAHEMARAKRAQLDSRLAQAEEEVRAAGIMRDYARIVAPFAGIVTARTVEPGNLAAPGAPLMTIEQQGTYRLEASVDESLVASVRAGGPVEVAIDSLNRKLNARVSEIVPAVDAASRAYTVKIDLPAEPELRSGMFGRALFPTRPRSVLAIPAAALVERGQLQSVFVIENGLARARMVTVGQRAKDGLEALSGVNAGERVAAPVPPGLTDGAKVEVRQ